MRSISQKAGRETPTDVVSQITIDPEIEGVYQKLTGKVLGKAKRPAIAPTPPESERPGHTRQIHRQMGAAGVEQHT
jgi:hypothetical protein